MQSEEDSIQVCWALPSRVWRGHAVITQQLRLPSTHRLPSSALGAVGVKRSGGHGSYGLIVQQRDGTT